ncbi:hypothetical protein A4R44_03331 [Amycolatopsis sp. M39]|nr:hypothetical protein A4R44_03331 [Amycolatopsis sp. M39]
MRTPRHDHRPVAEPDVVAQHRVAAAGQAGDDVEVPGPVAAHDRERDRRRPVHPVVRAVHDEPHALAERAVLADHELLRPVVVQHGAGLEGGRLVRVVVIGELADVDQRRGDQWFQQHHSRLSGHRVQDVRAGEMGALLAVSGSAAVPGRVPVASLASAGGGVLWCWLRGDGVLWRWRGGVTGSAAGGGVLWCWLRGDRLSGGRRRTRNPARCAGCPTSTTRPWGRCGARCRRGRCRC